MLAIEISMDMKHSMKMPWMFLNLAKEFTFKCHPKNVCLFGTQAAEEMKIQKAAIIVSISTA